MGAVHSWCCLWIHLYTYLWCMNLEQFTIKLRLLDAAAVVPVPMVEQEVVGEDGYKHVGIEMRRFGYIT